MKTIDGKRLFTTEQLSLKHKTDITKLNTTATNLQAQLENQKTLEDMTWQELAAEAAAGNAAKYVHLGQTLVANNNTWNHGVDGEFIWQVTDITDTDIGLANYNIARKGTTTTTLMFKFDEPQKATNSEGVANPGGEKAITYGSNLYPNSWIDQFLNTSAPAGEWGTPPTSWHNTPSWVSEYDGFMKGFDEDFLNAIKMTDIKVNIATVWQTPLNLPSQVTLSRKFYLLSENDLGFYYRNPDTPESSTLGLYNGAADADRIKYRVTDDESRIWIFRSAAPTVQYGLDGVGLSGMRHGGLNSNSSYGVIPACRIGQDNSAISTLDENLEGLVDEVPL